MTSGEPKRTGKFANIVGTRYGLELRRHIARKVPNEDDALEIAQEVMERTMQVPDEKEILDPLSYARRVADHAIVDFHRRHRRGFITFDSDKADAGAGRPPELPPNVLENALDADERLQKGLAGLPKVQRQIWLLYIRHGMSFQEIGAMLEFTMATVEHYFDEATRGLRNRLDHERKR